MFEGYENLRPLVKKYLESMINDTLEGTELEGTSYEELLAMLETIIGYFCVTYVLPTADVSVFLEFMKELVADEKASEAYSKITEDLKDFAEKDESGTINKLANALKGASNTNET